MTLPGPFQGAIAAWLERNGQGGRRAGSDALSATYRAGGSSAAVDPAAYLVARDYGVGSRHEESLEPLTPVTPRTHRLVA